MLRRRGLGLVYVKCFGNVGMMKGQGLVDNNLIYVKEIRVWSLDPFFLESSWLRRVLFLGGVVVFPLIHTYGL